MNNNVADQKITCSTQEIFYHQQARVLVSELPSGKNKIEVEKIDPNLFVRWAECETKYPVSLIKQIFDLKGPGWLCDEISREESSTYTGAALKWQLLSYVEKKQLESSRILDFGCGSGASTICLSRMFPSSQILGIEIEEESLAIAKSRAQFYDLKNVEFCHSTDPSSLPGTFEKFDHIIMTGVYEHLLPRERLQLLPQLWSLLKNGGILFLHETPNLYFPVETHTTGGLPFINYLPRKLALHYAQMFSNRNLSDDNWQTLLRKGIRGGTTKEIAGILETTGSKPEIMVPSLLGVKDRVDLWYASAEKSAHSKVKKNLYSVLKGIKRISDVELVPYLELALRKN